MKAYRIKNFMVVEEIDYKKSDSPNGNIFESKKEAIKIAIDIVNERINDNLHYLERLQEEIKGQEEVVEYYVLKRNKLIAEAKADNIEIDDVII